MDTYDLAVIGAGPGGYVAAIRAAQLGLKTALVERDRVGGLCLNWGCIPTKALLKNADAVAVVRDAERWGISVENPSFDLSVAVDRSRTVADQLVRGVEGLLKDSGVDVIRAAASFRAPLTIAAGKRELSVRATIVATGASTRSLPGVPIDGRVVVTSREALELRAPPRRALIVGAGAVGVEFAHLWATYGSEVTIIEMLDTLLPTEEPEAGRALARAFEARGIRSLLKTRLEGIDVERGGAKATISRGGQEEQLEADCVLVAVGFVPHTEGLNLEGIGVTTQRGFIAIDDQMQTNVPGVYAVGDVTGKLMLAHVASQQGVIAAEHIAGRTVPVLDYVQLPRAVFCQPQVGSVGYREAAAREAGFTVKTGRFPLAALGRAITSGHTDGFVKVVADQETGQVLGIHVVGHDANELLGEASLAALLEATTVEVGFAVHAHPTLSEAIKEAALAVQGEAIHIARRPAVRAAREAAG